MKIISVFCFLLKMVLSVFGVLFLINRLKDLLGKSDYEYKVDSLFGNEDQNLKQKSKIKRVVNLHDLYFNSVD